MLVTTPKPSPAQLRLLRQVNSAILAASKHALADVCSTLALDAAWRELQDNLLLVMGQNGIDAPPELMVRQKELLDADGERRTRQREGIAAAAKKKAVAAANAGAASSAAASIEEQVRDSVNSDSTSPSHGAQSEKDQPDSDDQTASYYRHMIAPQGKADHASYLAPDLVQAFEKLGEH